ncbi:juvenile hormone acid O-methyltransferase [Anoplophora glabripennis]|uniref:juvenile hormone acid O-methyltransferase n=1 Tax=Anoplophora glabripennis TaxID=217634 RepID=UPI000873A27F|nr:juvenile hormone acid O-methyltransferase [Anoplophora glabripennis]
MVEPKSYSKHNDLQKTDNVFVLDNFFRLVKWSGDDEIILDVGVGDGKFAVEKLVPLFPKKFRKLVGCDVSEKMVMFAKDNYKHPRIEFVHLDISCDEIPVDFVSGFNHVFSFYTLHWVFKQRQAFANMFKMLKPGGDMLLSFLANNPIYEVYNNMSENIKWKAYTKKEYICPYHGSKEPEKELEKILVETGLISHVCRVEKRTYYFPNLDILKKSIIAVNPIIQRLPTEEVPNYVDDFMNQIRKLSSVTIEMVNNNEEGVRIQYQLLVVFASKPLEKS